MQEENNTVIEKEPTTDVDEETKEPSMYRVILLNDDFTPMEFVVLILMEVFKKSPQEAELIMMQAHKTGSAQAGVYSKDVAETKVNIVSSLSKEAGFPLKAVIEEE